MKLDAIKKKSWKDKSDTFNKLFDENTKLSIVFLVKYSIIYFSPKNNEVYTRIFLIKYSNICLKIKSMYIPVCENLKKENVIKFHLSITINYILNLEWVGIEPTTE